MDNPLLAALMSAPDPSRDMTGVAEDLERSLRRLDVLEPGSRVARLASWVEDTKRQLDRVTIVGTGEGWGTSVQSLERTARCMVREAHRTLHLTVFNITMGATGLLDDLENALVGNLALEVYILINRPEAQDPGAKARLRSIASERRHRVRLVGLNPERGDLHAKILISDRRRALVGSANLSFFGLNISRELGVVIEGPKAWELADMIERLGGESGVEEIHDEP